MTAALLVIGAVGALVMVVALVFDDALGAAFDGLEAFEVGDWFSLPVLAGFVAAFGLLGGLASAGGAPTLVALAVGAACGLALGWLAARLARAAASMPTDAPPSSRDLVGLPGRVVTPVVAGSAGEVVVRIAGAPLKLRAQADADLARGSDVVVVEVVSPTSVRVISAGEFWGVDTA